VFEAGDDAKSGSDQPIWTTYPHRKAQIIHVQRNIGKLYLVDID
jgi:hypothetical protein